MVRKGSVKLARTEAPVSLSPLNFVFTPDENGPENRAKVLTISLLEGMDARVSHDRCLP